MDGLTISAEQFRATILQIQAKIAESGASPMPRLPSADSVEISPQAQQLLESGKDRDDPLEDELNLSSEDRLKMELIEQLFDANAGGSLKEKLEKIAQLMKENQQAAQSAQDIDPRTMKATAERIEAQRLNLQIEREDGTKISVEFTHLEMDRVTVQQGGPQQQPASDPLVLDLDGDGIELTKPEDGVLFDINGDGIKEQTAFVGPDDGFLAMDWDLNGLIESGLELFGDQKGAPSGFAELAKFDENQDSRINEADSIFSKLLIYRELNRDGVGSKEELAGLKDYGIQSISLSYLNAELNSAGNRISQVSDYQKQNGQNGLAGDAWLNYRA